MFVSENKYNEQAKKIKDLEDTIRRINNDKSMAYKRVNKLECENWDLRAKIGKLEKENTTLKERIDWFKGSQRRQYAYREKLDNIINAKNDQIRSLEDSITEICEAKDDLQKMCNDRYYLIKKYQDRCNWYSDCLRKNRELTQQLKEELEHKADFMCKPFLKEHEDMKKDFAYVLDWAIASTSIFNWSEGYYEKLTKLRKKWFDK